MSPARSALSTAALRHSILIVLPNSGHAVDKARRSALPKLSDELACVLKTNFAKFKCSHNLQKGSYVTHGEV